MDREKLRMSMVDSDDDVPIFALTTRAMDREKLRMSMVDSDDDVPIFALGSKPKETKKPSRRLRAFHGKREKRVQKPTRLDKAFRMIQEGAAEVNLIRLGNEACMDDKLASLITYVQGHPHVVSVELQASKIFRLVILSC